MCNSVILSHLTVAINLFVLSAEQLTNDSFALITYLLVNCCWPEGDPILRQRSIKGFKDRRQNILTPANE